MGKVRYNAEAAREAGEMTIADLSWRTHDTLLYLSGSGTIRRNNTRKRYWMPERLVEIIGIEPVDWGIEDAVTTESVLVPVHVALNGLENHVSKLCQHQSELTARDIANVIRQELQPTDEQ